MANLNRLVNGICALGLWCLPQLSLAAEIKSLNDFYSYTEASQFSGVVLLREGAEVSIMRAFGDSTPTTFNYLGTRFQIGSVTKQFAAAAILKLEEQNKLSTNDTLCETVPELTHCGEITIHQLLNHTAGLWNYTSAMTAETEYTKPISVSELLAMFSKKDLEFTPGSKFSYSNSGYVVAGAVIERVSGQTFHQFVTENLLAPANASGAAYEPNTPPAELAQGSYFDGEYSQVFMPKFHGSWAFAAGGLTARVVDLARWNKALFKGQLLNQNSFAKMIDGGSFGYGYGIAPFHVSGFDGFAHSGSVPGTVSFNAYIPARDTSVVVLSNNQATDVQAVAKRLFEVVTLGDTKGPDVVELPRSESELAFYQGRFKATTSEHRLDVNARGGKLYIDVSADVKLRMVPTGTDQFLLRTNEIVIQFERDSTSRLSGFALTQSGQTSHYSLER